MFINFFNSITKKHKQNAIRIQKFLHNILWNKYFLSCVLSLILLTIIAQLGLNIIKSSESIPAWRLWTIFVFSSIGTISGVCGTYYISCRSIKWIYFQSITVFALILALGFSFLPLQALEWLFMIIPAIIMYKEWKKQEDPNLILPKKLELKKLIFLFICAILVTIALGYTIQAINNQINPLPEKGSPLEKEKFYFDVAPFIDATILVFSVFAPILLAKRYWAGNYFFLIANLAAILMFSGAIGAHASPNYPFMMQNIIYLFYALIGISSWIVSYNAQH